MTVALVLAVASWLSVWSAWAGYSLNVNALATLGIICAAVLTGAAAGVLARSLVQVLGAIWHG